MRKLRPLFILFAGLFLFACNSNDSGEEQATDGFVISGTFEGLNSDQVFLNRIENNQLATIDTSQLTESGFEFTGKVDVPEMLFITFEGRDGGIPVFTENAKITVNFNFGGSQQFPEITGSASHDEYMDYMDQNQEFNQAINQLYSEYQQAAMAEDEVRMAEIDSSFTAKMAEKQEFTINYVRGNSASAVAPYLILTELMSGESIEVAVLAELLENLDNSVKASPYAKQVEERVNKMQTVAIGQEAPDFTQNNPDGEALSLSDFRGKYVLIDFWASWCRPCREENPNVVRIYNEYKDKGFEILGVSLDDDRAAWLQAIEADQLEWPQVSDLKRWENAVAQQYAVTAIPHTVLIDKDGKIIAKNLRGPSLEEKLAELMQ